MQEAVNSRGKYKVDFSGELAISCASLSCNALTKTCIVLTLYNLT